jgi:hypothetical protein
MELLDHESPVVSQASSQGVSAPVKDEVTVARGDSTVRSLYDLVENLHLL